MYDLLTIRNERIKLFAGFLNALALGLLGLAVLRPLTDDIVSLPLTVIPWAVAGIAMHGAAHYLLGYLRKELP